MKVVEKDRVVGGMLQDELKRCQEMRNGIRKAISRLPKGAISERNKRYKNKIYSYYCLKYRDGEKVINKHIPDSEIQEVKKKLSMRKKYEKEIQSYGKRIAYLHKILRAGDRKRHGNTD